MKVRCTGFIVATIFILAVGAGVLWAMSNPVAIALGIGSFVLAGVLAVREDDEDMLSK